jgi:hypothetical protein
VSSELPKGRAEKSRISSGFEGTKFSTIRRDSLDRVCGRGYFPNQRKPLGLMMQGLRVTLVEGRVLAASGEWNLEPRFKIVID